MKVLTVIVILLILFVYIRFYTKPNVSIELIQPRIEQLAPQQLFEKSPIVLSERIASIDQLLKSTFKYMYLSSTISEVNDSKWLQNRHRYIIIHADTSSTITIVHPHKMNSPYNDSYTDAVAVKLESKQVLIIPYKWWYKVDGNCKLYKLHDILSLLFNF